MQKDIITINQAIKLAEKLRKQGKKIVLAGGIFDIIHVGHIRFLKKAKGEADVLVVFLESDKKARETKGKDRPINTQAQRAEVLAAFEHVDFVVALPYMTTNRQYDRIVEQISPDVLAATEKSKNSVHLKRQAKKTGAKLKFVTKLIAGKSTSGIISKL